MNHNYLYVFPPRHGIEREYVIVGNGKQLRTVTKQFVAGETIVMYLPDFDEPKVLIEYSILCPVGHPLHDWPESISGFHPLLGDHLKSYQVWLGSRGFPTSPESTFLVRQQVLTPDPKTSEIFREIHTLTEQATALILSAKQSKERAEAEWGKL